MTSQVRVAVQTTRPRQLFIYDDVVLHHTLPIFTRLGWCLIVNWDFCWSSEHFWTGCPSCHPTMTFTGNRTRNLSSESHSSKPLGHSSCLYIYIYCIYSCESQIFCTIFRLKYMGSTIIRILLL